LQYLLHTPEVTLSFFSEAQLSGRAIKQTYAQLHLQLFYRPTDRGISLTELFCRPTEAAAFHNGHKNRKFF
jgi:hypothetical protein